MSPWRSFRVRLALWYVGVLAVVVVAFAVLLQAAFRQTAARLVDRELRERAERVGHGPRPGGGRPPDWARGRPEPPRRGGPERDPNEEAERVAMTWRPRIYFLPPATEGPIRRADLWDPTAVEATLQHGRHFSTVWLDGEPLRVLSVTLRDAGREAAVVQFARNLGDYQRLARGQLLTLLALLPLGLLVAGAGGLYLTDRALRPLREITAAAADLSADDLARRLPVRGADELSELARTFNGMLARLQTAFEQQRRFTADASHELRTPLSRAKVASSLALSGDPDLEEYGRALEVADRACDAMGRLIEQLLLLARADAGELALAARPVDLRHVATAAVEALPPEQAARIGWQPPDAARLVQGDAEALQRVVGNLLSNALRHTPTDQPVALHLGEAGREWAVVVADSGEGIARQHLPRLTQRFYRVDAARSRQAGGSGLGLAIGESIAQAHGGRLELASELGQGTTATLWLPQLAAVGLTDEQETADANQVEPGRR
ncbi:MAG: HAMP domain-containing protein [Fimbriimonadaceae bacterium]|nr:HAMP domain-containing protein [Fimbriimonadaceae bacterium]